MRKSVAAVYVTESGDPAQLASPFCTNNKLPCIYERDGEREAAKI
jgi:hypothetical protein